MDDFRVPLGFFHHPKTVKLKRRLGAEGVLAFLELWDFCTRPGSRWNGDLSGMTPEDVAIAAGWDGDVDAFVGALQAVGFLDRDERGWMAIHDWAAIQPYVAAHGQRREAGRAAAQARWAAHGHREQTPEPPDEEDPPLRADDAPGMPPACGPHQVALPLAPKGNAPYPSPTPYPSPDPDVDPKIGGETEEHRPCQKRVRSGPVSTVEQLTERVAALGWAVVLSPSQVVAATALLDERPIDVQELAWAEDRVKKRGGRPNVGLLLSVIKGERSKPKPIAGSEHERASRQERAPPRRVSRPPAREAETPFSSPVGTAVREVIAKLGGANG